jgi:carbohydrate-selective porin OprB
MDVDFGKLADWNGLTFHVTGLWQFGGNLGADMGTLANPSGLVSAHTTRLDSFWLQQAFLRNRLFLRAGQFAGLDFYGNQEYGASYLIEPLDYAFGNLFPTTYESFNPAGTPAAEIQVIPWRSRPRDGVAFAFVYTHIGDPFQSIDTPLGVPLLGSEKAIELNYAAQIQPYLLWQPVFQYYSDVGGNSRIPNAAVFGFRIKVDF